MTGGAGALGTAVLRCLAADHHVRSLLCVDVRPPMVAYDKLEHVLADIRSPALVDHFAGADVVIHLAYVIFADVTDREARSINVEGSEQVFRAAVACGATKLIHLSSIATYGVCEGHPVPIVESTTRRNHPGLAYASTKFENEAFLDELERRHAALCVIRLRAGILLGRQQTHPIARAYARGYVPAAGRGRQPLVWDEDVADAVRLSLNCTESDAFNLAACNPLPARELALASGLRLIPVPRAAVHAYVGALTLLAPFRRGSRVRLEWVRVLDVDMVASAERARTRLGWAPDYSRTADVVRHAAEVAAGGTGLRTALFMRFVNFVAHAERDGPLFGCDDARVHLALTGRGGGDFTLTTQDDGLQLSTGIARPPTATVTLRAATFAALLAGRGEFSDKVSSGAVRVEGEETAARLVDILVTRFRATSRRAGSMGFLARVLSKWLERNADA